MTMQIESKTIEEAYLKASKEFNCSVVELEIDIIQSPSSGILGMFKKSAIINVSKKNKNKVKKSDISNISNDKTIDMTMKEIKDGVIRLLNASCFDIELIKIQKYNNMTISIFLDGKDAALLIGKEGYRYKAFSYLLYNWANIKYDINIRLEIAEFLTNQQDMIKKYLKHVITKVNNNGRAQTKILDGILVKIALEELRSEFPDKYVGIRTAKNGGKYVLVNNFNTKVKDEDNK